MASGKRRDGTRMGTTRSKGVFMSTPALSPDERSQLLIEQQPRLRRYILRMVRNATDADDVLQDVNLVAWRKFDLFCPGTNFHAWCSRITNLQILKYRERRHLGGGPWAAAELDEFPAFGSRARFSESKRQLLIASLASLSPDDRHLVDARYWQKLGVERLSHLVHRPVRTVYRMLGRIQRQLRRSMDDRILALDEVVT